MAEFMQIATIVRKLFLPDVLPWQFLVTETSLEKLRLRYKFNELAHQINNPLGGVPPQIVAPKGEFVLDGHAFVVEQFIVQPSILQFQIAGDSDQADKFTADLAQFFLEIDPHRSYSEARQLTQTYQTIAIARLSVSADAMFSERFSQFLRESAVPLLTPPSTEIDLRLFNVRWVVSFRPDTPDFTYLPKVLAIEPRSGSRPSDMLYYTHSPSDFRTHKALIESFERALS